VVFGDEPGPVSQNLIDFIEISQFGWNRVQSVKPTLVSALQKELVHLLLNQVRTLMTAGSLSGEKQEKFLIFQIIFILDRRPRLVCLTHVSLPIGNSIPNYTQMVTTTRQ
jgi:hypothetical protein